MRCAARAHARMTMGAILVALSVLLAAPEAAAARVKTTAFASFGSQTCPVGTDLVYAGLAVGRHPLVPGSSASQFCVPEIPVYHAGSSAAAVHGGSVMPVEIRPIYPWAELADLAGLEMYCAVCEAHGATWVQHGSLTCPDGHDLLQGGWLVGGYFGHASRARTIFLHQAPLDAYGNSAVQDLGSAYPLEVWSVPGYGEGHELSGAQCWSEAATGAVFTAWGRSTCPAGTTALFSGGTIVSGAHDVTGSILDYLCLAPVEHSDRAAAGDIASSANAFPVQFLASVLSDINAASGSFPMCSVCQADNRPHQFLFPGKTTCPAGWTTDVSGHLVGAAAPNSRHEFACLASSPDVQSIGSSPSVAHMYSTETRMGVGAAEGYVDGRELSCSQCSGDAGAPFVHWGRSDCPANATLVYSGVAAGSPMAESGGGANTLCLPPSPDYLSADTALSAEGQLAAVEYRTALHGAMPASMVALEGADMPCALCLASTTPGTTLPGIDVQVLPGALECPAGWVAEYQGFQMAPDASENAADSVCVSADATASATGSSTLGTGSYMWPVTSDGITGHEDGRPMSCVVCSKPAIPECGDGEVSGAEECDDGNADDTDACVGCRHAQCGDGVVWVGVEACDSGPECLSNCTLAPAASSPGKVSTFVSFGSTACPDGTDLVFSGISAGCEWTDTGSTVDTLCLPLTLEYSPDASTTSAHGSQLYEVQVKASLSVHPWEEMLAIDGYAVLCAVCTAPGEVWRQIGSDVCPGDQTTLQKGWLFGQAGGAARPRAILHHRGPFSPVFPPGDTSGTTYSLELNTGAGASEYPVAGYGSGQEFTGAHCQAGADPGAVFTAWGKLSCPSGTSTVFDNANMVAARYTVGGTITDYLCASPTPTFDRDTPGAQTGGPLYAVEYNIADTPGLTPVAAQIASCSMCQATGRPFAFMQPGKTTCPAGWTTDYSGWLMSNHHNHQKHQYVCVDEFPDAHTTVTPDRDGGLLYTVGIAGSAGAGLGYVASKPVTCSQCSGTAGPTFVRWGRVDCPLHATRIYGGAGAGWSGTNPLCLASDPDFPQSAFFVANEHADLYPTEYNTAAGSALPGQLQALQGHDVPCALCEASREHGYAAPVDVETFHGRTSCPAGWLLQYRGFTMGSVASSGVPTDSVCIDEQAQAAVGGSSATESGIDFAATTSNVFGHEAGRPLSCVVCSLPGADICGDGLVSGAEQCDDSNDDATDACVSCKNARCGDGVVWAGVEECDGGADCTDLCESSGSAVVSGSPTAPFDLSQPAVGPVFLRHPTDESLCWDGPELGSAVGIVGCPNVALWYLRYVSVGGPLADYLRLEDQTGTLCLEAPSGRMAECTPTNNFAQQWALADGSFVNRGLAMQTVVDDDTGTVGLVVQPGVGSGTTDSGVAFGQHASVHVWDSDQCPPGASLVFSGSAWTPPAGSRGTASLECIPAGRSSVLSTVPGSDPDSTTLEPVSGMACALCSFPDVAIYPYWGSRSCPSGDRAVVHGWAVASQPLAEDGRAPVCIASETAPAPLGHLATSKGRLPCAVCAASVIEGPTAVHWGLSSCPDTTESVDTDGRILARRATQLGGSSELICAFADKTEDSPSLARGHDVELAVAGVQLPGAGDVLILNALDNREAACSLCRVPKQGHVSMLAGRGICPTGDSWTRLYDGVLVGGAAGEEPVCMSSPPSTETVGLVLPGPQAALVPVQLAEVVAAAASGFETHMEVACAVCHSSAGPAYVAWGQSGCESERAESVATGTIFGPAGATRGTPMCLVEPPSLFYSDGVSVAAVELYEATLVGGLVTDAARLQEGVCAVCQTTPQVRDVTTVVGSTECPAGWDQETVGYWTAGSAGRGVCVSASAVPHPNAGTGTATTRSLLTHVEFAGGDEVACAQCSHSVAAGAAVCGNGIVDGIGELCDDGNRETDDACIACQPARCGDGYTQAGVEACDDGNADPTDACVLCQAARCGDGFVWAGVEQCDVAAPAASLSCDSGTCALSDPAPAFANTYIHWGSHGCPEGSIVFHGSGMRVVAEHGGSGEAYCVPSHGPVTGDLAVSTSRDRRTAMLGQLEYDAQEYAAVRPELAAHDGDLVPCSMCLVGQQSAWTNWGAITCPAGERLAYAGYMVAGRNDEAHVKDAVCIAEFS